MIASLSGRITDLPSDSIIIQVGGVGLRVFVPHQLREKTRIGETVHLHTYLAVREDSLTLYGFSSNEEKVFFNRLLDLDLDIRMERLSP